jgi:hypothetical protein
MTVRSSFVSVTKSWPPALVLAIQAAASCLVSFLLAHLSVLVGKLTPTELAYIWVPLTGLYFTGVKEAEKKWPSWTWLLYLLPTKLP